MALFREGMAMNLKKIIPLFDRGQGIKTMAGTVPKMKAYAAATEGVNGKGKPKTGNYVPIYVALGMIGFSVALGLHTAKQQFMHAPAVRVKKSRREMVSEVDEPERVARESDDFIKKSFFRKVAHVQGSNDTVDDPIHGNPVLREPQMKSLKTAGVNPSDSGNDSTIQGAKPP